MSVAVLVCYEAGLGLVGHFFADTVACAGSEVVFLAPSDSSRGFWKLAVFDLICIDNSSVGCLSGVDCASVGGVAAFAAAESGVEIGSGCFFVAAAPLGANVLLKD